MGNYSLSVEAKADLAEIYKYGLTVLGQHVARNYIDALLKHFEEIAAKPYSFPATYKFVRNCRKSVFKNNVIYFNAEGEVVEVLAILRHQDVSQRFPYRI